MGFAERVKECTMYISVVLKHISRCCVCVCFGYSLFRMSRQEKKNIRTTHAVDFVLQFNDNTTLVNKKEIANTRKAFRTFYVDMRVLQEIPDIRKFSTEDPKKKFRRGLRYDFQGSRALKIFPLGRLTAPPKPPS